jgi:hypothetical protein
MHHHAYDVPEKAILLTVVIPDGHHFDGCHFGEQAIPSSIFSCTSH